MNIAGGDQNPERLFSDEYWGEMQPSELWPMHSSVWGHGPATREAEAITPALLPDIVGGKIQSPPLVNGTVWDPYDQDLQRNAHYLFPGTLLLVESEGLYIYPDEETAITREKRGLNVWEDNLENIFCSPRQMLREVAFGEDGTGPFFTKARTYARSHASVYKRYVELSYVGQKRFRGLPAIVSHLRGYVREDGLYYPMFLGDAKLHKKHIIGQSYELPGGNEDVTIRSRLSHVEVLQSGESARVPDPGRLFSFLGKLAHSK